jgi:opacity protein-like surface antigen
MKKFILFIGIATITFGSKTSLLNAETEAGDHYIRVFGGGTWPQGHLKDLAEPGLNVGTSYRYQIWDYISGGVDFNFSDFSDRNLEFNSRYEVRNFSLGPFIEYDIIPENTMCPYLLLGLAWNQTRLEYVTTTKTYDSDANKTGLFAGLGVDYEYMDSYQLGAELRYQFIDSDEKAINLLFSIGFRII